MEKGKKYPFGQRGAVGVENVLEICLKFTSRRRCEPNFQSADGPIFDVTRKRYILSEAVQSPSTGIYTVCGFSSPATLNTIVSDKAKHFTEFIIPSLFD